MNDPTWFSFGLGVSLALVIGFVSGAISVGRAWLRSIDDEEEAEFVLTDTGHAVAAALGQETEEP